MKDIRSEDLPHYIARFTEFRVVEAMLRTESGSIQIILETRLDALGNEAIFTVVDDRKIVQIRFMRYWAPFQMFVQSRSTDQYTSYGIMKFLEQ